MKFDPAFFVDQVIKTNHMGGVTQTPVEIATRVSQLTPDADLLPELQPGEGGRGGAGGGVHLAEGGPGPDPLPCHLYTRHTFRYESLG